MRTNLVAQCRTKQMSVAVLPDWPPTLQVYRYLESNYSGQPPPVEPISKVRAVSRLSEV